jgi:hypothetical protein
MTRHTAHVSRTGLVIIGLILLLAGGAVLARGLNASSSVLGHSDAPLLTHSQVTYPTQHGWVWPVAAAAAAVIALLALWWMAAQTSTKTVRRLPLEPDRIQGTTVLRAGAATGAITDELESYPSIRAADATLQGSSRTPTCDCLSPRKTAQTPPPCALASKPRPAPTCVRPSNATPSPPCCACSSAAHSTGTSPDPAAQGAAHACCHACEVTISDPPCPSTALAYAIATTILAGTG